MRRQSHAADIQVNLLPKDKRSKQSHQLAKEARTILKPLAKDLGVPLKVVEWGVLHGYVDDWFHCLGGSRRAQLYPSDRLCGDANGPGHSCSESVGRWQLGAGVGPLAICGESVLAIVPPTFRDHGAWVTYR